MQCMHKHKSMFDLEEAAVARPSSLPGPKPLAAAAGQSLLLVSSHNNTPGPARLVLMPSHVSDRSGGAAGLWQAAQPWPRAGAGADSGRPVG